MVLGIIVTAIVLAGALVTENLVTQQQVLLYIGNYIAGTLGERNVSFQFHLDRPGRVTGAWDTYGYGVAPPSTAYLYESSQCHAQYRDPYSQGCDGPFIWKGLTDSSNDSLSVELEPGSYTLNWEAPNATASPYVYITAPITLTPTPWWWV